ncbi:carbon starvation CstA family protein [Corynebacterium liangguodongii]|uniref:Carbon starvation protein A n=1 Tax=Corynebacterium liangguodongii TaxID=2079535 RepID=A0A2S0WDN4_9CORY|nr:carbon starvation CstA family protein [Corynebacterium liangguodongii]AWB83876.1 carbon starvation protein A [Corynebacterium liangguodongii]PWB99015.1 carbon starvation protein A [Corynebacterium liangguodongii]
MSTTVSGRGPRAREGEDRLEKSITPDGQEHIVGITPARAIGTAERIGIGCAAVLAALGWAAIALGRHEEINAVWLVCAAVGSYVIGFTLYARLIEYKVVKPRSTRATPAEYVDDGADFVPTDRRVLFGHHFAAIAGAGPLVGPVMAAQMGYLPGTLWIILGVIFAGAVQDYLVLWISTRRRGRSLGQMITDEVGRVGGAAGIIATMTIMVILIAVLGLVVVGAMAESPWSVFSLAMTIPIAVFMGCYSRFVRPGRVVEVSAIGVVLLLAAIIGGGFVADTAWGAQAFTLSKTTLAVALVVYGIVAAVLPVWLLLAPRDYLSTFMKIGVVVLLAVAILFVRPTVQMPAVTSFALEGNGPVFAGSLFPFLFITIACGALSGFHALISSGTTPKLIEKESHMRAIGYGSMLMESFVAVMAMITAVIIDRHMYFAINAPAGLTKGTEEGAAQFVATLGLPGDPVTAGELAETASAIGEPTIVSRTGGAPTFSLGMSEIMTDVFGNPALQAFWYHFALMFEALFILTTVDAGTRVARFMMSDSLGHIPGLGRFKDPSWRLGSWISTLIVCAAWGLILVMGVTDPLGGINVLFPLFGIANQLLAAIALTLVTVVVVKKGLYAWVWVPAVPLVFDLVVTLTASWQKIFHSDPAIGYFAQNARFRQAREQGLSEFGSAKSPEAIDAVIRNTYIQGGLSILFAVLVIAVVVASIVTIVKAVRARRVGRPLALSEEPDRPSTWFIPRGMVASAEERELARVLGGARAGAKGES